MANFNPGVKDSSDPSYLGVSQGISRPQPNRAMETLFSGIGDLVEGGAKAIDDMNINNIEKDIYSGVDAINGEHGVDAVVGSAAADKVVPTEEGRQVPDAVAVNARRQVEGMDQAFKEGKMTDLQYKVKLATLSKGIRSQYPGYRAEIDSMVQRVTGMNPANAVRAELLQVWEKSLQQQESRIDKDTKFRRDNIKYLSSETQDLPIAQVEKIVSQAKQQEYQFEKVKTDLDIESKLGNLTAEKAEKHAGFLVGNIVNRALNKGVDEFGFNKLQSKLSEFSKNGKIPTGPELEQINLGIGELEKELTRSAMSELTRSFEDKNGRQTNLMALLGAEKVKGLLASSLLPVQQFKEALHNKDYGAVGAIARANKAQSDSDLSKFYAGDPIARVYATVREAHGPDIAAEVLRQPGNLTKMSTAVSDFTNSLIHGDKERSFGGEFPSIVNDENAKKDPQAIKTAIGTAASKVGNPKVPIEEQAKAASRVYNKDLPSVLNYFKADDKQDSKMRVFEGFFNPAATKSMLQIKATNPDLWNNYKETAKASVNALFKQEISTAQSEGDKEGAFTIDFDEATKGFKVNRTALGEDRAKTAREWGVAPGAATSVDIAVSRLNKALGALAPIVEADGETVLDTAKSFVDMKTANEPKPGFWSKVGQGLSKILQPGTIGKDGYKEEESKPNPKKSSQKEEVVKTQELSLYNDDEIKQIAYRTDDDDGEEDYSQVDAKSLRTSSDFKEYAPILELIRSAEAPGGFNQIFGKNRSAPLNEMTVAEALTLQRQMVASGSPSSAIGGGQFIQKTLRGLVRAGVVDPDEKMTQAVQERLMVALIKGRGYDKWKAGKISDTAFQNSLAKEWAGLPTSSGRSYYAGDGLNASTVSDEKVMATLRRLKGGSQVASAKTKDDELSLD